MFCRCWRSPAALERLLPGPALRGPGTGAKRRIFPGALTVLLLLQFFSRGRLGPSCPPAAAGFSRRPRPGCVTAHETSVALRDSQVLNLDWAPRWRPLAPPTHSSQASVPGRDPLNGYWILLVESKAPELRRRAVGATATRLGHAPLFSRAGLLVSAAATCDASTHGARQFITGWSP